MQQKLIQNIGLALALSCSYAVAPSSQQQPRLIQQNQQNLLAEVIQQYDNLKESYLNDIYDKYAITETDQFGFTFKTGTKEFYLTISEHAIQRSLDNSQ